MNFIILQLETAHFGITQKKKKKGKGKESSYHPLLPWALVYIIVTNDMDSYSKKQSGTISKLNTNLSLFHPFLLCFQYCQKDISFALCYKV